MRIFEPEEKIDITGQSDRFATLRPIMLPEPWANITIDLDAITVVFQDVRYMGELRHRWNEMKKLRTRPPLT